MKRQAQGITLIALVITIIILLILAGISISSLTGSGLFEKAKLAKNKTEEAQELENQILSEYENQMDSLGGSNSSGGSSGGTGGGQTPEVPADPTKAATSITEAQSDYMLTKTVNSTIKDAYENEIIVPAGFKIKVDDTTNNATTVDKGIVIIDSEQNEFVWIPVPADGKVYTNAEKTEYKTIKLNRYTFDDNGNSTAKNDVIIDSYYQELAMSSYGNTTAKDIEEFKTSVTTNHGYYIGRYEARTATKRKSKYSVISPITENGSQYVYNYVTQIQAADLARNMYDNKRTFKSDLMNSYAWDTATLFLQKCGDNSKYSKQACINYPLAETGTNDTTKYKGKQDVQCNVYDMASNIMEWTTETSVRSTTYCVRRGGDFSGNYNYTSYRGDYSDSGSEENTGFRLILYL